MNHSPDLNAPALAKLREPFDPSTVGQLPRLTCKACSDKNCQEHRRAKCNVCEAFISTAHMHLSYVGHAETTDRLLSVDPAWTWEPVAWAGDGSPLITSGRDGRTLVMWIRLTVCGVTRLGVGSVDARGFDSEKQLIGDALRNAAMRFGVALSLWSKAELESSLSDAEPEPAAPPQPKAPERPTTTRTEATEHKQNPYAQAVHIEASKLGLADELLRQAIKDVTGDPSANSVNRENRAAVLESVRRYAELGGPF